MQKLTLKKIVRSTILALVLLGGAAGGVGVAHHSVTVADSTKPSNLDVG
ncbi:MAG: hypothetical protein P8Y13_12965 [Deinococcales bacterium]|jgi:hypothetical protein